MFPIQLVVAADGAESATLHEADVVGVADGGVAILVCGRDAG